MQQSVLITGANKGIGLQFVKRYHQLGWRVLAACRQASEALKKLDVMIIENIDIGHEDSTQRLKDATLKTSGKFLAYDGKTIPW